MLTKECLVHMKNKDTLEETTVEVVDETERILSLVKDSIVCGGY